MANWITYGAVVIRDVKLIEHRCEPIPDYKGIHNVAVRHTFVFLGVIYPDWNQVGPVDNNGLRDNVTPRKAWASVQEIEDELRLNRLKFRYYIGNDVAFEAPPPGQQVDFELGPKPVAVQMVEVNSTGAIIVRFGIQTTKQQVYEGNDYPWIADTHFVSQYDVDGDTQLTVRNMTFTVRLSPQAMADNHQANVEPVNARATISLLSQIYQTSLRIPEGFKREKVRGEISPNGTELRFLIIDKEVVLPLGTLSPATKLEATYTVIHGLGGSTKEGAIQGHGILNVRSMGPKTISRHKLLRQAMALAVQKLSTRPNFMMFTRAQIVYLLHEMGIMLQVECMFKPVDLRGPGGIHIDEDAGLRQAIDEGDIDDAFAPCRAEGEAAQGSDKGNAQSPWPMYLLWGTWIGKIVHHMFIHGLDPERYPITKADFCLVNGEYQLPELVEVAATGAGDDEPVDENPIGIADNFTIPDIDWGFDYYTKTWLWEQTKMATKYTTKSGVYVLPIAGNYPGTIRGTEDPEVAPVALHGEYTIKEVQWENQAIGDTHPPYPSSNTLDVHDTLIETAVVPHAPTPLSATMKGHTIQGNYLYGRTKSVKPGTALPAGKLATSPGDATEYTYPGGKALDGYLPGG